MVESVCPRKPLVNRDNSNQNSMSLNKFDNSSMVLFHSGIKSDKTRELYDRYLKYFKTFVNIKSYDDLLEIELKQLQSMIQSFVMNDREKGRVAGTINGKLSALKLFFEMNDVVGLNWLKLRKMIPEKRKNTGGKPYTTKQVEILVNSSKTLGYRAIIHFMSASGVRAGAFEELRIKDVFTPDFDSHGCKAVLVYADSIHEYYTFIHQEAVEALDDYLNFRRTKGEEITPDSWLFCSPIDSSKHYQQGAITSTMSRHVKRVLGREQANRDRYEIMSCHGFRKRFVTICKDNDQVNISLAEKLVGHSVTVPLDNSYHKPLLERLFVEYSKHIPQLVIDDKYRLELELEKSKDKDDEIASLKNTILEIKYNMLELQNKIKS
jgi:integrase